jgi:membrane peptidoglycan carboxypeptidase
MKRRVRLAIFAVLCMAAGAFFRWEMRTSRLQAFVFSRVSRDIGFEIAPGPSPAIRFPGAGPYDVRLGYARLPEILPSLESAGYAIETQARVSERFLRIVDLGFFPIYREKDRAGLLILDRRGEPLDSTLYPGNVYSSFDEIPSLIADIVLYIENRELLDPETPHRNPAVEWDRLAYAVAQALLRVVDPDRDVPGGSTLATQMEKYRHSTGGFTSSFREKAGQMLSASLRAYLDGEETIDARRGILRAHLNSLPLAAVSGYGEVIGLGDGLSAWYGSRFEEVNRLLSSRAADIDPSEREAWGLALKEVVSLILAQRRPTAYFRERDALERWTNSYLVLLANAGIVTPIEKDLAGRARLGWASTPAERRRIPFVDRKAANAIRVRLLSLLGAGDLYELDRLDLTVTSSLDARVQDGATRLLRRLEDPEYIREAGLDAFRLLDRGDPSRIIYSVTIYERGEGENLLRVQADNLNQPLNINEGTQLELGSSAKLRTLATYLEVIAEIRERLTAPPGDSLRAKALEKNDPLTRWAVRYLASAPDTSLAAMLDAALERRYSASPAEGFFTGGGLHHFSNFNPEDDGKVYSVRDAFRHSVNLVFIRLMRDVVEYFKYRGPGGMDVLKNAEDPRRREYLERFADREGRIFIRRFHGKYKEKTAEEALELLIEGRQLSPARLAALYCGAVAEASADDLGSFLRANLPQSKIPDATILRLHRSYAGEAISLVDRGFVARVHPLEVWTVAYLRRNPEATLDEAIAASKEERLDVYGWLFRTHKKDKQDKRIRTLLEIEAFQEIHHSWKRLGYPFASLVPSYATAIGSSGDRPAALAELAGIIQNGGMRVPTARVRELHFAEGTPFETKLRGGRRTAGERVLLPAVADRLRRELIGVVEEGTARRLLGAFTSGDGRTWEVGGKTGTGDNRHKTYGAGGALIDSVIMSRTASFVFLIGDRFFGTVVAYVEKPGEGEYRFTSTLPVHILKLLAPVIQPLLEDGGGASNSEADFVSPR